MRRSAAADDVRRGGVDDGVGTRLHHDDDPEEVFHSAARPSEGGQVLSLLDTGRLARLAAAWSEDAAAGAAHDAADAAPDAQADAATRLYALLQVGAQQLAVPAEALTEVIPMPALARFGGGIDSAWCSWRGRHLAILPPGALLAQAIDETRDEAAPLLAGQNETIFHPMKGPMTTQTLRGLSTHGATHWRGDRLDGFFGTDDCLGSLDSNAPCDEEQSFLNFIVAFEGLIGHDEIVARLLAWWSEQPRV